MAANGKHLKTVDDVIEALGGDGAVKVLFNVDYRHLWNWRDRCGFPPDTFFAMTTKLHRAGKTADPRLWKMRAPA